MVSRNTDNEETTDMYETANQRQLNFDLRNLSAEKAERFLLVDRILAIERAVGLSSQQLRDQASIDLATWGYIKLRDVNKYGLSVARLRNIYQEFAVAGTLILGGWNFNTIISDVNAKHRVFESMWNMMIDNRHSPQGLMALLDIGEGRLRSLIDRHAEFFGWHSLKRMHAILHEFAENPASGFGEQAPQHETEESTTMTTPDKGTANTVFLEYLSPTETSLASIFTKITNEPMVRVHSNVYLHVNDSRFPVQVSFSMTYDTAAHEFVLVKSPTEREVDNPTFQVGIGKDERSSDSPFPHGSHEEQHAAMIALVRVLMDTSLAVSQGQLLHEHNKLLNSAIKPIRKRLEDAKFEVQQLEARLL